MKGLLIAGTASNVGKTTATLALIAMMRRRQIVVQPFKAGPDFLDAGHHSRMAGRPSRNIDTWMLSIEANTEMLRGASAGAQIAVVEGMMGLFDGKDETQSGSSAEISKVFGLPVILILDAAKTSHSIAATVLGFELFDETLPLAGVILNRVANQRHFEMLQTSISSACRTPVLGWIRRDPAITIPERHLGLKTSDEHCTNENSDLLAERFADAAHIDLDMLLALARPLDIGICPSPPGDSTKALVRIGIARDQAFNFYYEDNLDLLRANGGEIVPFSPMRDRSIPDGMDALYFGGGYPELYSDELSGNHSMLESIRRYVSSGIPIYAECGGMIYLSRSIETTTGTRSPMVGVLPFSFAMTDGLVQFGYVTVQLTRDCILGTSGTVLRGHSFHYSRILDAPPTDTCYRVQYSIANQEESEGYLVGNVLASYIHLHFRTAPQMAQCFINAACAAREREGTAL